MRFLVPSPLLLLAAAFAWAPACSSASSSDEDPGKGGTSSAGTTGAASSNDGTSGGESTPAIGGGRCCTPSEKACCMNMGGWTPEGNCGVHASCDNFPPFDHPGWKKIVDSHGCVAWSMPVTQERICGVVSTFPCGTTRCEIAREICVGEDGGAGEAGAGSAGDAGDFGDGAAVEPHCVPR